VVAGIAGDVAHGDRRRRLVGRELTGTEVAGNKLALLNVGGEVRAFEDRSRYIKVLVPDVD
jgi:hypothetical protein